LKKKFGLKRLASEDEPDFENQNNMQEYPEDEMTFVKNKWAKPDPALQDKTLEEDMLNEIERLGDIEDNKPANEQNENDGELLGNPIDPKENENLRVFGDKAVYKLNDKMPDYTEEDARRDLIREGKLKRTIEEMEDEELEKLKKSPP
jgi:hypothetical protein